ncbi:beta-2-glycoprotein 1 [Tachyglossus aculeatus]|uniref:beta-2-glycoprotein 1 n=1 Tax=Tachyglossus aculeatus TaxID=9261 RepID=UPI0018F56C2C|nr:beta-2-glycoprotein 1 [Tachyglossus aculeatus]
MDPKVIFLFGSLLCHLAIAGRICPRPQEVPFATVEPLRSFYEPGDQIVYTCKPGYSMPGEVRRYICPLTGLWPVNTVKCLPKVCPFTGRLENGSVRYTTFEYPNTLNFACNPGYVLNGTNSVQCLEDGKWSKKLPVCDPITCPPPTTPNFAKVSYYKPSATNNSIYKDEVVFECLPPYAMFGNATIRCTENGNWTELPECRDVKCPFPTRPDNGYVNYPKKIALHYKDKATYGCHSTYTLDGPETVECGKTGTWSAQPTCKASCKVSVKKATVLYKGNRVKIQEQFKNGMFHGERVAFFCKNKEKKCSFTEEAQCIDGILKVPDCFKEHSSLAFWKTDASDVPLCS